MVKLAVRLTGVDAQLQKKTGSVLSVKQLPDSVLPLIETGGTEDKRIAIAVDTVITLLLHDAFPAQLTIHITFKHPNQLHCAWQ